MDASRSKTQAVVALSAAAAELDAAVKASQEVLDQYRCGRTKPVGDM